MAKMVLVIKEMYIMKVHLASLIMKNADVFGACELQACAAMHVSVCGKLGKIKMQHS